MRSCGTSPAIPPGEQTAVVGIEVHAVVVGQVEDVVARHDWRATAGAELARYLLALVEVPDALRTLWAKPGRQQPRLRAILGVLGVGRSYIRGFYARETLLRCEV
jgi:hypothetical protein